jgi:acyl dehydratase
VALSAKRIRVGESREQVVVDDLKRSQIVMYAGASGDFHPVHTDERFARATGLPGVFAHGMLTMGMTGRVVTDRFGAENVKKYGVRFTNQVWPGDDLKAKAVVEAVRQEKGETLVDLTITTTNQKGDVVVSGYATARVEA